MLTPMKTEIITIAGKPGSGKTTTANEVARLLGYTRFSSGDFMRQMAKDRGMSILELGNLAEKDPRIDHAIDEKIREVGQTEKKLVIDSRLAFHWIPESFTVYLTLDLHTAAERILKGGEEHRKESGEFAPSLPELETKIVERFQNEQRRYKERYNIDPQSADFDITLDTSHDTPEHVAALIVSAYKKWLSE